MSSLNANEPSLVIGSTLASIPENVFRETIEGLGFGEVERVDMPPPRDFTHSDGKTRSMRQVYVHFKSWSDKVSTEQRVALANGLNELKVVYDGKHYWKCRGVEYKSKETVEREQQERTMTSYEFVDVASC